MLPENYKSESANSVMLQDSEIAHKNPLYYHALATKERKIKGTIPFTISSKRIKCVWLKLPTVAKNLYPRNYMTLMKVIKDDTNKQIYYVLGLEESIFCK